MARLAAAGRSCPAPCACLCMTPPSCLCPNFTHHNQTAPYPPFVQVGDSWNALAHIRQAVTFLVIHQKHRKSFREITEDLCSSLSVQQLYRISTMYWDDRCGEVGWQVWVGPSAGAKRAGWLYHTDSLVTQVAMRCSNKHTWFPLSLSLSLSLVADTTRRL